MATQDDYIRTALRVPPDLHAQIHGAAKKNNRTFNAEIVARLQSTFHHAEPKHSSDLVEETAVVRDELKLSPTQIDMVREAGEAAVRHVLRLQAQGFQPVCFGTPSAHQNPTEKANE